MVCVCAREYMCVFLSEISAVCARIHLLCSADLAQLLSDVKVGFVSCFYVTSVLQHVPLLLVIRTSLEKAEKLDMFLFIYLYTQSLEQFREHA